MGNRLGACRVLNERNGVFADGGCARYVLGICLKTPLAGSLAITGITAVDGGAMVWNIPAGTAGFTPPPGSGHNGGASLAFTYTDPADTGKAIGMWSNDPY